MFCLFLFMFVFLYCIVFVFWTCIYLYAIVLHWMHVRMIICFAMWSLSHFFMIVLVYSQVALMFYIMFTWLQFTYYIILVLLILVLPWGSNEFCASVSDYRYICSKFITASRFRCEWVLPLFPNSLLSLEYVLGCFVTE